ncbi:hypothetical protein, partial [Muricauda sp. TY007]|uniref:hypothetical protein n=1 Tax=Allomuricauda sp. TY007 TaxID=2683200 RepID=UPI00193F706C
LTKKALRLFTDRSNLKVGHFGPAGVGHFRPASYGHFNPARVVYYVRRFQRGLARNLASTHQTENPRGFSEVGKNKQLLIAILSLILFKLI